ncbi:hypothetical protein OG21DRAFT_93148 [Imleria badia]|nr:hypothetical protein OG21DRAFT_93148 [Imleria badia]
MSSLFSPMVYINVRLGTVPILLTMSPSRPPRNVAQGPLERRPDRNATLSRCMRTGAYWLEQYKKARTRCSNPRFLVHALSNCFYYSNCSLRSHYLLLTFSIRNGCTSEKERINLYRRLFDIHARISTIYTRNEVRLLLPKERLVEKVLKVMHRRQDVAFSMLSTSSKHATSR